jgi:hypothetical protein
LIKLLEVLPGLLLVVRVEMHRAHSRPVVLVEAVVEAVPTTAVLAV